MTDANEIPSLSVTGRMTRISDELLDLPVYIAGHFSKFVLRTTWDYHPWPKEICTFGDALRRVRSDPIKLALIVEPASGRTSRVRGNNIIFKGPRSVYISDITLFATEDAAVVATLAKLHG